MNRAQGTTSTTSTPFSSILFFSRVNASKKFILRMFTICTMILFIRLAVTSRTAVAAHCQSSRLSVSAFGLSRMASRSTRSKLTPHLSSRRKLSSGLLVSTSSSSSGSSLADKSSEDDDSSSTVKVPRRFVSYPFEYRQEIDLEIDTLTNRGWGIGRVTVPKREDNEVTEGLSDESTKKWVVMVPNVIPGERVRVRIFRNFGSYSEADLLEVLEASKDRVENPKCPLSTECGGCQYQHMTIELQRDWKTRHVQEAYEQYDVPLVDSGGLNLLKACWGTDHVFGYRSKLTPHYQAPSSRRRPQDGPTTDNDGKKVIQAIGFQKQSSRQIVDVENCPIATDSINTAYHQIREKLLAESSENEPENEEGGSQSRKKRRKKNLGATLLLRQANLDDGPEDIVTNHKDSMTTLVNGLKFTYRAGNFFQNNYYVLPSMVDHVVHGAIYGTVPPSFESPEDKDKSNDRPIMTHLVDCYCGSGLFAIQSATNVEMAVGIEINEKAVGEATANAEANGVTNCRFLASTAEGIFDHIMAKEGDENEGSSVEESFPRNKTVVVVDPPRKGCSPDFLAQLFAFGPARITYLSCDPTTQARDAREIIDHGYRITSVQPFDLFPMTRHIECLTLFEKL